MEPSQRQPVFSRIALIASGGVVVALFTVIASASFAALIFAAPLDQFVARGIWMALITALIVGQPLRFVIMDFRRVSGLDSSAAFSLWKVYQLGRKLGFTLVITQLRPEILKQLEMGGLRHNELPSYHVFPDLDHGLEWCERLLLGDLAKERNGAALQLAEQLSDMWPKEITTDRLLPYLERKEIPQGTHLIRQSELSESLYFIESGQVTARLELDGHHSMRLRTQGAGTVVGEVGLFLGGRRIASVITEQPSTVYLLSTASLQRMGNDDPALSLAFHQFIVRLLAERLTTASNMLRDFQQ